MNATGLTELAQKAQKVVLRAAGLMSGTSADGVDVAIVDLAAGGVELLAFRTFPYPAALRRAVLDLSRPGAGRVDEVCHFNFVLGEVLADALIRLADKANIPLASIDLVGSHGQTICHIPRGRRAGRRNVRSTLQIAEPAVIAERTGITTVADFRTRDVAAGGQGAPLVPIADYVLFADAARSRAVQNIGGIANVTYLPAGGEPDDIVAFDTGPGNMIIDHVVHKITRGQKRYDRGGRLAAAGHVNRALLDGLMRHPYLLRRPPKSTGREQFGAAFADELYARARKRRIGAADILATVTAFTAASIARAYERFLPDAPDQVILCGGGAQNTTLVGALRELLRPATVMGSGELGIDPDAKEAISFAILAARTITGAAGNVPAATGARRAAVLGKIVPGN